MCSVNYVSSAHISSHVIKNFANPLGFNINISEKNIVYNKIIDDLCMFTVATIITFTIFFVIKNKIFQIWVFINICIFVITLLIFIHIITLLNFIHVIIKSTRRKAMLFCCLLRVHPI